MADTLGDLVGLVPVVIGAGLVLGTLGMVKRMNAPKSPKSMKDYKNMTIKKVSEVI